MKIFAALIFSFMISHAAFAQEAEFNAWLERTAQEAVASGIRPETVRAAFSNLIFDL